MPQVFDPSAALVRLGNDDSILRELIECFLHDMPGLMSELAEAVNRQDAKEATRLAHSVKGLASSFDAHPTVETAQRMESAGRAGRLADLAADQPELRRRVDELGTALQTWLQRNPASAASD